jgi:hypothetical protein
MLDLAGFKVEHTSVLAAGSAVMQGNTSGADLVPADAEELPQVLELVHSNAAILTLITQVLFPSLSWIDTKIFVVYALACSFFVYIRCMLCPRR